MINGTPSVRSDRASPTTRLWAGAIIIKAAILFGIMLAVGNLLFGLDLPGAIQIEHLVYSLVVTVYLWLTDENWRMIAAVAVFVLAGPPLFFARHKIRAGWRIYLSVASLGILAGQMVLIVLGTLMEKEIAISALAGVVLYLLWPFMDKGYSPLPVKKISWGEKAAAGLLFAVTVYYLFSILGTAPTSYGVLRLAEDYLGRTGANLPVTVFYFALFVCLIFGVMNFPRSMGKGRYGLRIIGPWLGSLAVLAAFAWGLGRDVPMISSAATLLFTMVAAGYLSQRQVKVLPDVSFVPLRYPARMIFLSILALACMFHAYAFRVFSCSSSADANYLHRIGDCPEVFRAVLDDEGENLYLVYRTRNQIVKVDLADDFRMTQIGPGALAVNDTIPPDVLPGLPEDMIFLPGKEKLLATFLPNRELQEEFSKLKPGNYNDIVISIDAKTAVVEKAYLLPDICWINCIRWDFKTELLYIGCEDTKEMLSYDLGSEEILRHEFLPKVGDIQDLEIDSRTTPKTLYAISLWFSSKLSELDESTWEIKRQTTIGGANYEMAVSPSRNLLFVSRFYESRVVIIDIATFEKTGILKTGLGTRALAVDDKRGLLLASSIYDGRIRIYDFVNRKLIGKIQVGGHVKSIALDSERGFAYFGGRCGLYRLDLDEYLVTKKP